MCSLFLLEQQELCFCHEIVRNEKRKIIRRGKKRSEDNGKGGSHRENLSF